jgi:hypothetical protein
LASPCWLVVLKLAGSIQEHFKFSLPGVEAVAARLIAANQRLGVISKEQERRPPTHWQLAGRQEKTSPADPQQGLSPEILQSRQAKISALRPGLSEPCWSGDPKRVAAIRRVIYRKPCGE